MSKNKSSSYRARGTQILRAPTTVRIYKEAIEVVDDKHYVQSLFFYHRQQT